MIEEDNEILQRLITQGLSDNEKEELLQSYRRREGLIDIDLSTVDIEEPLRPLVEDLNESGFRTFRSSGKIMKQYYVLTNRGKTFLDETWEHLKDKGMYNVMDAMDDERYRFLHEIFRVLGGDRSGDIIIYDEEDNCLDDDALNFCKVRNLMRPIGVDKIEGMLIDRAKKIKGVWSNIMMLYIKMAYGHSSVDEDNILYDFLESKMKELKEYGGSLDEENQEIYRRFMALKKYNIKFAGEFVINRVHHFLCDSGDLCDVLFPDGDIGEVQEILGVMHENNAEGNGFYGKGEEHYFYERNSEHKRKVKSTKKEKQKTVIKRHIFRKNVSG